MIHLLLTNWSACGILDKNPGPERSISISGPKSDILDAERFNPILFVWLNKDQYPICNMGLGQP